MHLNKLITDHYRSIFLLLLTALLVTGSLTQKDKNLVVTTASPHGMLCMELNNDTAQRSKMLAKWDDTYKNILDYHDAKVDTARITGIQALHSENTSDYLFIPSYVLLFLLFIVRLGKPVNVPKHFNWQPGDKGKSITPFSKLWVFIFGVMVIVAGLMDVLEDIGINSVLHLHVQKLPLPPIGYVFYPAAIKWALIIIVYLVLAYWAFKLKKVSLWLEELSADFKKLLSLSWQYRIVLITLAIFFLVLYLSDQGQDLLLTVNGSGFWGSFLFLLTTTIIAALCWHVPKALENAATLKYGQFWLGPVDFSDRGDHPRVDLPRLLGAAGFLVPATGMLKTMQTYHVQYFLSGIPAIGVLAGLMALYTVILRHHWIQRIYEDGKRTRLYYITMAILALPVIVSFFGKGVNEPSHLLFLFWDLVVLSLMFLITTTLRTCIWPDKQPGDKPTFIDRFAIARLITFGGAACGIFFILCNFPGFLHAVIDGSRFYTIPIVFCAVAGYMLFFSYLLFLGKKTGIYFTTIILLFTFLQATTTVTSYHNIAVVTSGHTKRLDSLSAYAEKWLLNREPEITEFSRTHNGKPYPVYFVNSHGGGIRAAVWTTMAVGALDSVIRANNKSDSSGFQHHVFSYSGASGGTVGSAFLCGARFTYRKDPQHDKTFLPGNHSLYQTDNLTSDIVALLGRDLVIYSFGIKHQYGIIDRARLMEEDWELNAIDQNINLKTRIGTMWPRDKRMEVPLLFSNTYDINQGRKGIVAPVLLNSVDFPAAVLLEQSPELGPKQDLRLSTAAFLSARFPYVSPTGKHNQHNFTDGGTIENAGAETSLQAMRVFERARQKLSKQYPSLNNISINILSLVNEIKPLESPEQETNLYEPLGPPLGILKTIDANAKKAEEISRDSMMVKEGRNPGHYSYTMFQPQLMGGKNVWPVLPLGWQISDAALTSMDSSARKPLGALNKIYSSFGMDTLKKK